MKANRLLDALKSLAAQDKLKATDIRHSSQLVRNELTDLIPEFVEEVFKIANISKIESRISEARKFNKDGLEKILKIIKEANPPNFELRFEEGARQIDSAKLISEVQSHIDLLAEKGSNWSPIEVVLRVEMSLDHNFDDLLMAFSPEDKVFEDVKNILVGYLNLIGKDEILLLWSRVLNQFKSYDIRKGLNIYPDLVSDAFFENSDSIDKVIDKVALFISKIKPLTMRKMVGEGITIFPAGFPGVAKIATISPDGNINKVTNLDILVVRLVSQIVAFWEELSYKEPKDLAKSIGANSDSIVFDGEFYREAKKQLNDKKESYSIEHLYLMSERLLKYAEEYSTSQSNVAQILWQYKLGQEIIAPRQTKEILSGKVNELYLQKSLSHHLINFGVLSFGRTFGRSEVDLYTKEFGEDFVIETKVYKKKPTSGTIKAHLVQLQSYMDQVNQPRGVLAIYNCTDDMIISPRKWLRGRIWILAINIGIAPPNKRNRSIEVVETNDKNELIGFIENSAKVKVRRKKLKTVAKRKRSVK